jgi:hypothetical protein
MLASFLGVLPILTPPLCALAFIMSLLLYRKATDLCILTLYPATLLKVVIRVKSFWMEFLGAFKHKIISSANKDNSYMNHFYFCLLSYCSVRNSRAILNKSDKGKHLCFILNFSGMVSFIPHFL